MEVFVRSLLGLLIGISLGTVGLSRLEATSALHNIEREQSREALYLPQKGPVRLLSFGYQNLLSDYLWFKTINYFGKQYSSSRNYQWLNHMCRLVIELNPRAPEVSEFCSNMLAWEARLPEEAVALLTQVLSYRSSEWYLFYQRGFIYLFFLNDQQRAKEDFVKAASFPDAHPSIKSLAAKKIATLEDPNVAIDFLAMMLSQERNESAKSVLRERLHEVVYERDIRLLEGALKTYRELTGADAPSLEAVVQVGILKGVPPDPFGGTYVVVPEHGGVRSSTGHKRLTSVAPAAGVATTRGHAASTEGK